jgi:hypothetical protein
VLGGGGGERGAATADIWAVDPAAGTLRRGGRLPAAISDAGAASTGGQVVLLGGRDATGRALDELWRMAP